MGLPQPDGAPGKAVRIQVIGMVEHLEKTQEKIVVSGGQIEECQLGRLVVDRVAEFTRSHLESPFGVEKARRSRKPHEERGGQVERILVKSGNQRRKESLGDLGRTKVFFRIHGSRVDKVKGGNRQSPESSIHQCRKSGRTGTKARSPEGRQPRIRAGESRERRRGWANPGGFPETVTASALPGVFRVPSYSFRHPRN